MNPEMDPARPSLLDPCRKSPSRVPSRTTFCGAEQHQHVALCIGFVCSFRLSKTSPNIGFYELTWYYSAPGCFHNSSSKNGSSQLCSKMVDLYPTEAGLISEVYW